MFLCIPVFFNRLRNMVFSGGNFNELNPKLSNLRLSLSKALKRIFRAVLIGVVRCSRLMSSFLKIGVLK